MTTGRAKLKEVRSMEGLGVSRGGSACGLLTRLRCWIDQRCINGSWANYGARYKADL